jgi:phosphoglycerol transferase MdoB-like AlkP superfamily enzyme
MIKDRFESGLKSFVSLSTGFFIIFLLIRLFDFLFIGTGSVLISIISDILFFFYLLFLPGVIFIIISLLSIKAARIFYFILAIHLSTGYLLLLFYFSKSAMPLGSDLYGYSLSEISHTISASGGIEIMHIISFIIAAALVIFLLSFSLKLKISNFINYAFASCIILCFLWGDNIYTPSTFQSQREYFLTINKLQFFVNKSTDYFFAKKEEISTTEVYYDSGSDESISFKYIDKNYPFLHEEKAKDVLGNFFSNVPAKPNIVFILVESLGRGYSGKGAYLGSFTPFLDSLAEKSLYWENFLSTGGRTFAALPSLFGSLPYASRGFLDLGESMPKTFTLIDFLKYQGYKARFYHGGDIHFDNMDIFLRKNNIDFILGEDNFGGGYNKMPASRSGFSWGYGDKDLFSRSLAITGADINTPRLDIYLTLSMHSPFLVENQDYYVNRFYDIYRALHLSDKIMKEIESYKSILATVLYTDDAFRSFFNEYKKRKDYGNTIFFITGDHRMPEIPIATQIDRFHVPFIIYSPLLKRTARFSSISSHFDFTPTLLAFLKNECKMQVPTESVFIGSGIDTVRGFRNIHSYPLMRNKNELIDYVDKEFILSDNILYNIYPNLDIEKVTNDSKAGSINNLFNEFRKRNNHFIKTKRLTP